MLASALLVVSTTLAGSRPVNWTHQNCTAGEWFAECAVMDGGVRGFDQRWPWEVGLGVFAVCAAPTVVLGGPRRVGGVLTLCACLGCFVALMLCQLAIPHRSVAYAVALHGSAAVLGSVPVGPWFRWAELWALRHAAVGGLVAGALRGPSLAVVQWPGAPGSVTCAALAHLIGAVGSDLLVRAVWGCSGWMAEFFVRDV